MAGYAAGCQNGYKRGRREGQEQNRREQAVLVRTLRDFFERVPWAFKDLNRRRGTDAREENFLLVKLLAEAQRREPRDASRADGAS